VQISFWGVRGSYPAPRADTLKYGGNTTCLEVQTADSRLIVDAGTGIYALGQKLAHEPAHHHLVFTHVHWDHIQGIPFFAPLEDPAARVTIYAQAQALLIIEALFTHGFRQIYLPIPPVRLKAQLEFKPLHIGETWHLGGLEINTVRLNHPYICVGFRFRSEGRTAVFYSDLGPYDEILFGYKFRPRAPRPDERVDPYEQQRLAEMRQDMLQQCQGADLLIHDSHYTPEEYRRFPHFGHSTPDHAIETAVGGQVKRLLMFHHSPTRSDAELEEMEKHYRAVAAGYGIELEAAREGQRVVFS
jgi:phosphoribosyl 1,2-cyclic phosphodiesterase